MTPIFEIKVEKFEHGYIGYGIYKGADVATCTGPTPLGVLDNITEAVSDVMLESEDWQYDTPLD